MSNWKDNITITCPSCGFVGTGRAFDLSDADECFCPKCQAMFEIQAEDEDEETE